MTKSEPNFRTLYVGVASLLVNTHNKLMHLRHVNGSASEDDDEQEVMARFAKDFNRSIEHYQIKPNGGGKFIILDRP